MFGTPLVTGYEVGVNVLGSAAMIRVRMVGRPAADPDGLVRVPIDKAISDLPPGDYEISVRVVGLGGRSEWSQPAQFSIPK